MSHGQCFNFANKTKYNCHTAWGHIFPRLVNIETGEFATQEERNGDLDLLEERMFCRKCVEEMER